MTEYAALHDVSLLLAGRNIQISRSEDSSEKDLDSLSRELESICSEGVSDDELFLNDKSSSKNAQDQQDETTGIETIIQPKQEKAVMVLVDKNASGNPDARWRAHGLERRRNLLEDDMKNGGRDFSLSYDCSVQRYFSVAHWALEQFHQLYESSSSINDQHQLEEMYVMGFRIISFLTECLPEHPGLKQAPYIGKQAEVELDHLRKCLEDVALRIDECVCDEVVEDNELFLDSMIAAQMEEDETKSKKSLSSKSWSTSSLNEEVQLEDWVDFDEFKKLEVITSDPQKERKLSESPTSETVGTTGTESLEEAHDSSDNKSKLSASSKSETESVKSKSSTRSKSSKKSRSSARSKSSSKRKSTRSKKPKEAETEENHYVEDDRIIRGDSFEMEFEPDDDDESFTSYSDRPIALLRKSVSLDFLKTIACEPVLYETDSEAADSWANGDDKSKSRPCLPSSSGVTPTADPARIAFRNLMTNLTASLTPAILKRTDETRPEDQPPSPIDPRSPRPTTRAVSPTFSDIMEERVEERETPTVDDILVSIDDDDLDAVVDNEIEEYLEQMFQKNGRKKGKSDNNWEKMMQKQEKKKGQLGRKLEKQEHQRVGGSVQHETRSVQREARSVHSEPWHNQKILKEQNRGKLAQKLRADPVVQGVLVRTRSRDSTKKSVSFDESSISSSSSSVTGLSDETPSPSYTSLSSLRKKSGSQTSAFSAYSGTKPIQPQPIPQQKLFQPILPTQRKPRVKSPEMPFDEPAVGEPVVEAPVVQEGAAEDNWMDFKSGSSFFEEKPKPKPRARLPRSGPRSGLC